ncbi:MAG TPA: hypothetical protein VFQ35_12520, partial [Polyangiaceae bacterium]|nr:hypothetical protein [Polyangiaceae bacterium]
MKPPLYAGANAHPAQATCRLRRRSNQRLRFLSERGHRGATSSNLPVLLGSPCGAALIATIANALARSTQLEQGFAVALQLLMDATGSALAAVDMLRGNAQPPLRVEVSRGENKLPHFQSESQLILAISRIDRASELAPDEVDRVLGVQEREHPRVEDMVIAPIGEPLARRGLLWLQRPSESFTSEDWRSFAEGVASQVSQGLERRQTEAELSEHARLATLFADVSIALASTASLEV